MPPFVFVFQLLNKHFFLPSCPPFQYTIHAEQVINILGIAFYFFVLKSFAEMPGAR